MTREATLPSDAADAPASPADRDPSWFLEAANDQPRELLLARYRQTLGLNGQPLPTYGHGDELPPPSPVEVRKGAPLSPVQRAPSHENRPRGRRRRADKPSRKTLALLWLSTMLAGGAIGFATSQIGFIKAKAAAAYAMFLPAPAAERPALQTVAATVVRKKTVATATLQVRDVSGHSNSLIPLDLSAAPADSHDDLLLKLSGLPDSAYLTAGHREAPQVWTLSLKDLDNVKVVVADTSPPRIDVAVAAFEPKSGEMVTPVKTMTIAISDATVEPAAAPPPSALPAKPAAPTELSAIPSPVSTGVSIPNPALARGDSLLKAGDADGAREAYLAAFNAGQAAAALGIARSYDPLVHAQYKVAHGSPDTALAVQWYERAASAGQDDAQAAIVRLKLKP